MTLFGWLFVNPSEMDSSNKTLLSASYEICEEIHEEALQCQVTYKGHTASCWFCNCGKLMKDLVDAVDGPQQ